MVLGVFIQVDFRFRFFHALASLMKEQSILVLPWLDKRLLRAVGKPVAGFELGTAVEKFDAGADGFALGLDGEEKKAVLAALDDKTLGMKGGDLTGLEGGVAGDDGGVVNFELLGLSARGVVGGEATGPRVEGADAAFDFGGGKGGPINESVGFFEFGGEGGGKVVLRGAPGNAKADVGHGAKEEGRAHFGEAGEERDGGFGGCDLGFDGVHDVAGIHAFIHHHGRDAGAREAVGNGPLDRRGAAQKGKDGEVDVEATKGREVEEFGAKELAVGDNNEDVRFEAGDVREGIGRVDFLGRGNDFFKAEVDGFEFAWARRDVLAAASGTVGLGNDANEFDAGREIQGFEQLG